MTTPRATVVVVNYQGAAFLPACLDSVARQTVGDVEALVVDNGSSDGSLQLLARRFPWVRVLRAGRNLGFAEAVNRGAAAARGDYLALVNNDAWIEDGWLEACLTILETTPEVSSCATKVVLADAPDRIDTAGDGFAVAGFGYKIGWLEPTCEHTHGRHVFGASAAASVLRRSAFMHAGGFDADYFIYGEDVDLSFRLQLLGHGCLYVPEAIAHHRVRATVGLGSALSLYLSQRNSLTTVLKDYPAWLLRVAWPHMLAYAAANTLVVSRRRLGSVAIRGQRDALLPSGRLLQKRRAVQSRIAIERPILEQLLTWRWISVKRRIWRAERSFQSWLRRHSVAQRAGESQ